MANGAILRGEVYWVCVDDSVGSEQQTGRPALIISGDKANEKRNTVIVAYMTTGGFGNFSTVTVNYCGKPERVLCDQVRTLDKQRLTRYMGKLSEAEMRRVSGGLAVCMCLRTDGVGCEDVFDRNESEELISLKAELDMWKRSYDVVMSQLVEMKVAAELAQRMSKRLDVPPVVAVVEEAPVEEPVVVDPPKQHEPEPEPELVEINTCSAEDLKRCGCSPVVIENIINDRPYMSLGDLRTVNGVTSVAYGILKHKLCCVPVKVEQPETVVIEETPVVEPKVEEPVVEETPVVPEKVNINTALIREMSERLGINTFYAGRISSHRNKNGKFVDLEELKMVEGLPKNFYDRYAHLCTTGEPEIVEEPPVAEEPESEEPKVVDGKVNVNTATAEEIYERTKMSFHTARNIIAYRKKNGPFRDIADLVLVDRFGVGCLKSYGDMLTVGEPDPEQEPESEKLNINTASMRELMAVGFEKRAAALIVNERKKYGRFRDVEDLSAIPEISGKILRKLRDKLEV